MISLFRAVSDAEWADIQSCGDFRVLAHTLQGKWFAETQVHATTWGQRFYHVLGEAFVVVEVEVPTDVADDLFHCPNLDNIGPARFADLGQVGIINTSKNGPIRAVAIVPLGPP
jgi:hypothetical protein